MDDSNKYLKKLNKPLLNRGGRLPESALNVDLGKPVPVEDNDAMRARLLELDKKIKSKYVLLHFAGWFIAIAFSLAIAAGLICSVKPGTNVFTILTTLLEMESIVWIPALLIIRHNRAFRDAVNNDSVIQGYEFPIQAKWIYEYIDETSRERMYLIQFANVYVDVGFVYDALKCGDSVIIYIVSYHGKQYFADWSIKPRR